MKYMLCDDTWDHEELEALQEVLDARMFSMNRRVEQFEREFAAKMGSRYAVMVSSGSAANLLLISAMVYSGCLSAGDEVIVPAVSWSTTYFPLYQMGLKIKFVDVDRDTLNIDIQQLENAVTDRTRMIFAVNLLGNPNEFDRILDLCKTRGIFVLEDNCESLGGVYKGRQLGTIGFAGTYSTFYSHHLCTMEGGVVVTDDKRLYEYMLCIRAHGWTRNLPPDSEIYHKHDDDFYESFHFIVPGFNLRPLEMEGALGSRQLKKMDRIIAQRRENGAYFTRCMQKFSAVARTQKIVEESSYFGFSVVLQGMLKGRRKEIVERLKAAQIEVRPIVAGNFVRNEAVAYFDYEIFGTLENADDIHENGFFIGNHSQNNFKEIDYFISVFSEALKSCGN